MAVKNATIRNMRGGGVGEGNQEPTTVGRQTRRIDTIAKLSAASRFFSMSNAPFAVVFRSPTRQACRERRLVLSAAGIDCQLDRDVGDWRLLVTESLVDAAVAELDAYAVEQAIPNTTRPPRSAAGGAIAGVIVYVGVLLAIAVASHRPGSHEVWVAAGGMSVGKVGAGQLYRSITALTLHADVGHLLSNLAFGGFYGLLAGRSFGGGVAWLAILAGGAIGNAATTWFRGPEHTSIGASTAVFAALGILVADGLRPVAAQTNWFRRMAPLIVGTVVLAMTGLGGERTDVGAHVAGFIAGMPLGWLVGSGAGIGGTGQRIAAGVGLFTVMLAWGWAITVAPNP